MHGLDYLEVLFRITILRFHQKNLKFFLTENSIDHVTTPVGHPATNGQAENAVKTVKNALKRVLENVPISRFNTMCRFLFDYRNTVNLSTGVSPVQLIFNGRKLRLRLVNKSK